MATEILDILVRSRGVSAATRGLTRIAGSAFRVATAIGAVTAAFTVLLGARGIAGLVRGSIDAAASIEGFGIRLRALLGSQGAANQALTNFVELSARTPFAVNQIIGGATTLASVVDGNRESLEGLTLVAANLAAVTGLSFEQSAENLQRSLASGIASADLFRERGVRQLIESITGVPNIIEQPLERQRELIEQAFGVDGRFGTAAEDLANTLTGALSNIGDAAFRFRASFGEALSPAVVAVARGVFIPFLDELRGKVDENRDSLSEFAVEGAADFIEGAASLVETLSELVPNVDDLSLSLQDVKSFAQDVIDVFDLLVLSVRAVFLGFRSIEVGFKGIAVLARGAAFTLGLRTEEEFETTLNVFENARQKLLKESDALNNAASDFFSDAADDTNAAKDSATELADNLRASAARVREIGAELIRARAEREAATEDPLNVGGDAGTLATKEQLAARTQLLTAERQIRNERLKQIEPLQAEIAAIEDQVRDLEAMDLAEEDIARKEAIILQLRQQQAELQQRLADATFDQAEGVEAIREGLQSLEDAGLDPTKLAELQAELGRILAADLGVEERAEELRQLFGQIDELQQQLAFDLGDAVGDAVTSGLSRALDTALSGGDAQDILAAFAETMAGLTQEALKDVLEGLGEDIEAIFDDLNLGDGFGRAVGAAIGVGASLVAGALQETEANVRSGLARSAVTSTQEVRGVVVGPTSVAVAQVDRGIREGFVPVVELLEELVSLASTRNRLIREGASPASLVALLNGSAAAIEETTSATLT